METNKSMSTHNEKIFLYGDESHSNEIITYSFLIIPSQKAKAVEHAISETKNRHNLNSDTKLHCRELFNAHARKKTELAKFTEEEILNILRDLMTASFSAGARAWVGYLNTRGAPDQLLFESIDKAKPEAWSVRDLKIQMLFCYQAASATLTHIVPPKNIKAYVDGDKTKILYLDNKRRQLDTLRSFFPVEHSNEKISPEPLHGQKPLILDLADVLAYAAARGLTDTVLKNKHHFISIVNSIDPGYSEVIFDHPFNGGAVFSIRSYDPSDRVKAYLSNFIERDSL